MMASYAFAVRDHALAVRGHSPTLQGCVELGHKAQLIGLTISVLCRTPDRQVRPAARDSRPILCGLSVR